MPRFSTSRLVSCWLAMVFTWPAIAVARSADDGIDATVAAPAADVPSAAATAAATTSGDIDITGPIDFTADQLDYDRDADIVTATGHVDMRRQGARLTADRIVWNRASGQVTATGNVVAIGPEGDKAYGDSIVLTDSMRDGVVENLLLVLADGGRLAASRGTRTNGVTSLDHASYTPCAVIDDHGCPKQPLWRIDAVRVYHDPIRKRIKYKGARLSLLGVPIMALPSLSHPDGSQDGGSGLLVPDIAYQKANGFELAIPYYLRLGTNRDLTLTPHVYTNVAPALEAKFRHLTEHGAYQISGMATVSSRSSTTTTTEPSNRDIRGYIDASGRLQLDPLWRISGSLRLTTDKTFMRRYDISNDDRLRSTVNVERIGTRSYFSVAGWAVQDLRPTGIQGRQPVAIPAIDWRLRLPQIAGGNVELRANSIALLRTQGQDTQSAHASVQWERRMLTGMGQEITFTGYARADVYNANDTLATTTSIYRGREGWSARGIAAAAVDVRYPLAGALFKRGTQRITPRIQLVGSPRTYNLRIPNEDSRAIELEDSNLFALNRFPGFDRWEDGARITYGLEYAVDLPRFRMRSVVGQSYRLDSRPRLFPDGTGLTSRTSDIVGRTSIQYGRFLNLVHRFRLDKDNLAVRRNEVDATIGTKRTYAMIGYLRLNRNITTGVEDLRDREELRLGARIAFNKYWSIFGSTVVDLTRRKEDPVGLADGYQPVRHRVGIGYEDDCVDFGFTWKRDYSTVGDAKRGNSYLFRLAFKNLGR